MQTNQQSAFCAHREFSEWASLFLGDIFVKIATYVDESGRHDKTGNQQGSQLIVVSGWVDWCDNWSKFCVEWQAVLEKHGAPYFHFAEWAYASRIARTGNPPSSSFQTNPYKEWNVGELDGFLYELAKLAGEGQKIMVGGFISTRDFAEAKKHPDYSRFAPADDPYQACLNQFFERFSKEVQQQWKYWTEPVTFFFDQNDDAVWIKSVHEAFEAARKKDPRIAELHFVNSKQRPHLPIQAADMLCSRMRQHAEKMTDPNAIPNPAKLDDLLILPSISRSSPEYYKATYRDYLSLMPLRYGNFPWRDKT